MRHIPVFALAVAAPFLGRLPEGGVSFAGRDIKQVLPSTALIAVCCGVGRGHGRSGGVRALAL